MERRQEGIKQFKRMEQLEMQRKGRAKALEAEESAQKLRESVAHKKQEQTHYNAEMRRLRM